MFFCFRQENIVKKGKRCNNQVNLFNYDYSTNKLFMKVEFANGEIKFTSGKDFFFRKLKATDRKR